MRPFLRYAAVGLIALLAACSGGGSGSSSPSPAGTIVKIGIDLPLSGADTFAGQTTANGALLAIDQAKPKAPAGLNLAAFVLDDAVQGVHSAQQGAANTRTFIADPSVLGMIGPYNSDVAAAEIPLTNAAGLVQVSASTVSDGLTLGADAAQLRRANPSINNFFRVCTTDSRQGSAGAQFARKLGLKRVYIIDDNETYGLDLANLFEADFKMLGGTVLGHDHVTKDQQDFKALLTKAAAAKPDAIFFGGTSSTGGGLIRKQMFDAGLGALPFIGGDGIADQQFIAVAGKRADGTYYTVAAPNALKLPAAQQFVKDYQNRFHSSVGPYSANAYAAAQVLIAAIERAVRKNGGKSPNRAQVLQAVAQTSNLPTPIGPISFDKRGDVTNPVLSLYEIRDGKPNFITQLNLKI
ncbi:MAG: branched-chain amino acid ABC transporter substrate-binding protein [Candidatus Baltobacteraceae bacterium]